MVKPIFDLAGRVSQVFRRAELDPPDPRRIPKPCFLALRKLPGLERDQGTRVLERHRSPQVREELSVPERPCPRRVFGKSGSREPLGFLEKTALELPIEAHRDAIAQGGPRPAQSEEERR